MSPGLLTLVIFASGVLAVVAGYSVLTDLYLRDRSRVSRRVDDEFRRRQREKIQKAGLFKGELVALATEAAADERPTVRQRFVAMVDQSGLNLQPDRLLLMMVGGAVGCGAIAGAVRQSIPVALIGAVIGGLAPFLYVRKKQKARLNKMIQQLPDAFDLMARVVRAGQTMSQAYQAVAEEFDQPLAGEFTYCVEQQNLGLLPEEALRDLARRTGLLEIKIFVLALLVQQQSGGNLAETLDRLAYMVRERFRVQGKIRVLTAEGRAQALVLLVIPFGMMALMTVMNKNYADSLFKNAWLPVAMLISEGLGALWIRKIVSLDF